MSAYIIDINVVRTSIMSNCMAFRRK